ncbi:MAG: hypothetical protein Q4A79_00310 [Candidatus Saccharibacteria bacterium]|nr:hypothetical protein [Candidatus Saccharibacteria bacterium]
MEKFPRNNMEYGNSRVEQSPQNKWVGVLNALTQGCDKPINRVKILDYCKDHLFGEEDEQTPVPHEYIGNVPNGIVGVSDEVYQFINLLRQATTESRLEYPFVLTGYMSKNHEGMVIDLNRALYARQSDMGSSVVSGNTFTELLRKQLENIQEHVRKNNTDNKTPIVCIEHTHPAVTRYYGTTDFGDLRQLMNINSDDGEGNERSFGKYLRQKTGCEDIRFIQCTIMQNGDVDFMNYDKRKREFRKFSTVANYDRGTKIQSYTFDTPY